MPRKEGRGYVQIPWAVLEGLEHSIGVTFDKLPTSKYLTLRRAKKVAENAVKSSFGFERIYLLGHLQLYIGVIAAYKGNLGMYDETTDTVYIKRTKREEKNVFGKDVVSAASVERFTAEHELGHAYLNHSAYDNSSRIVKRETDKAKNGQEPNLEQVMIAKLWEEGICDFVAIEAEKQLFAQGKADPQQSFAVRQLYMLKTGTSRAPDTLTVEKILAMNTQIIWKEDCFEKLQAAYALFVDGFRKGDYQHDTLLIPHVTISDTAQHSLGYAFAHGAFSALREAGKSPEEAFAFLITHPPKSLVDISRPAFFIRRTLIGDRRHNNFN